MARPLAFLLSMVIAGGVLHPAKTQAQSTDGHTIGLTDAQKAEILSHNNEASVADARAGLRRSGLPTSDLPSSGGARAIHGEVGAEIGTHGERGMYGAAAIPLGDNAGATVSFESDRYGHR